MSKPLLGFVGLGAIGLPIASNLVSAGFDLRVHTRTRKAERDPCLKFAISCSSPKELALGCDVLFICVSDDKAVEEVLFSSSGVYENLKGGSIVIDLSTINPSKSRLFARRLAKKDIRYVDAPVSGGTEGAWQGTLTVFLGCGNSFLKQLTPFLEPIAKKMYCFGDVGKGQEVKAINQILVAGSYVAVAEAIALGQALGLQMGTVVNALKTGAANSWALCNRSESMLNDEYPLGFKLSLHHKDLSIALQIASERGLKLPITSKVKEIEKLLIDHGYGDDDVSVLRKSI